jgi:hypothetical protein
MDVIFTRTGKKAYTTLAHRDDGVTLEVQSFDRTSTIPHDIAHFVVERELRLERGFWGSVSAGAMFESVRVLSGRRRPHASDRSRAVIKGAGQQLAEAETWVAKMLEITEQGLENDWSAASAILNAGWRPRKSSRSPITAEEVSRCCAALRKVQQQWETLPPGKSLTVSWRAGKS